MIKVKVKPNSKKQEIIEINENELIVFLKHPAFNNKANIELIKLLKKYFSKEVKIIKGLKSKYKIVELK